MTLLSSHRKCILFCQLDGRINENYLWHREIVVMKSCHHTIFSFDGYIEPLKTAVWFKQMLGYREQRAIISQLVSFAEHTPFH